MPRRIKKLKINEISVVDKPAMEGATIDIEKRYKHAGKELPKKVLLKKSYASIAKALNVGSNLYVYEIRDEFDIEWSLSKLIEAAEVDLPFIAKYIQARAEQLDMADLLPTKGAFANLVKQGEPKGKKTKKEAKTMPKTVEELEKELKEKESRIAELESEAKKEAKPENEPETEKSEQEVYKAADGKEYTGEAASLAKRLDEEKADRDLEKRAKELDYLPGDISLRKTVLKSLDAIEDEKEREAAHALLKSKNERAEKAFKAVGDLGQQPTEENDAMKAFQEERKNNPDASMQEAFVKSHSDWTPNRDAPVQ